MRMQEALQVVESYIDSALMNSSSQIEIIHGKEMEFFAKRSGRS